MTSRGISGFQYLKFFGLFSPAFHHFSKISSKSKSECPSRLSRIGTVLLVFLSLGCIFGSVDFCLCGLMQNVTVKYIFCQVIWCNTRGLFCLFSRESKDLKKSQTMASDASHMLEAALEQMDDIIAGTIMFYFTPYYLEI